MNGQQPVHLLLGSGGVKVFFHIGLLFAIAERKIPIGKVTGVSIGAVLATFIAQQPRLSVKRVRDILQIFLSEFKAVDSESSDANRLPGLRKWMKKGHIDVVRFFRHIVGKYNLKPRHRLRIVACTHGDGLAVVFNMPVYDLAVALAGSCAMKFATKPVPYQKPGGEEMLLVDGGNYHPTPTDLCPEGTTIVSNLGFASKLPRERLPMLDFLVHLAEMVYAPVLNWLYKIRHKPEHIIVEAGSPDVATMSFGISIKQAIAMVQHGYQQACAVLDRAILENRLPGLIPNPKNKKGSAAAWTDT